MKTLKKTNKYHLTLELSAYANSETNPAKYLETDIENHDEIFEIIKTGSIWYKKTDVHDVAVETFDDTAIIWSRITLSAMVRGTEANTEFTVTEVYKKKGNGWKMLALTFSSVRDTHVIKH
ncbi:DUF4440 domain-containing protein [Dyadobacter sp. NIV53]|uniref:DUF4440 domain-containing protein n=1 Tax=Dyadobacter sp. NIV53 TaxID=2861765 RepID=UPI001E5459B9|nr:DUF4440 domain-containing protein [Dyadobacter sp. NIV53]